MKTAYIVFFLFKVQPVFNINVSDQSVILSQFLADYIQSSERIPVYYSLVLCRGKNVKDLSIRFNKLHKVFNQEIFLNYIRFIGDTRQGFVIDMNCSLYKKILQELEKHDQFEKYHSWLFLMDSSYDEKDTPFFGLREFNFRLDSLVIVADISQMNNETIELVELYKIRENTSMIKGIFGMWDSASGLMRKQSNFVAPIRRWDLLGTELRAAIVITNNASMNYLDDMANPQQDSPTRLTYSIVKAMVDTFNASLKLLQVASWGTDVNGSWDGMVGLLFNKNADIACSNLFINKERLPIVEYVLETSESHSKIILSMPPLSNSRNLFTLPFSKAVWYCCFGLVIIVSVSIHVAQKLENKTLDPTTTNPQLLKATWSDVIMLNISAICQQGWDPEPRGLSGRIITILLYAAVMSLYVSYSASIVSLLQASDTSIRTLKDLYESSVEIGAEDISYQRYWIKRSIDPYRRAIYQNKIITKTGSNFMTIEEGVRRLKKGSYAFQVETSRCYLMVQATFQESEKCVLKQLPDLLEMNNPYIPIPRGTPFGEHFKIGLRLVAQTGVKSRIAQRLYRKKPACAVRRANFVNVGLKDCYHVFLYLVYGLIASVMLLVIERVVAKRCAKF